MDFLKFFVLIVVFVAISNCEVTPPADKTNPTSKTTPAENKKPAIVPTDVICNVCACARSVIDCHNKSLTNFFTIEDWAGLESLAPKTILMHKNNLTTLSPMFELPLLKLDLSHNSISTIKKATFKQLQFMKELDLSYNNLTAVALRPDVFEGKYMPEEYQPLRSMRILRLSYNSLHSLHQDVFEHLPELEELRMDGNPLTMLDHVTVIAIAGLTSLKTLDLSNCQLKSLPDNFLHTPIHLEWLDLSKNQLEQVPSPLEEARSLQFLSLSENPIKFIGRQSDEYTNFPVMPSLKTLMMSNMPNLEAISEQSMAGLQSLITLHMDHNPSLRTIHPDAFIKLDGDSKAVPFITKIYLSHNNLSRIESNLISRLDLIEKIDIRENPFMCDCTTQWMVSVLANTIEETSPEMTGDIICHEPLEMRGKSMIHLEEIHRTMRCVDSYGNRPERDGAILIGSIIGILIAIPVVLGLLLMQKRGYFAACGLGGPASFSRAFYKRADNEYI